MTINYTSLLGLAKPVTGTEDGLWGDIVNDQITSLVEDAVANAASFSVAAGNVTLTTTNGASNQARCALLIATGSPGTTRNIVAPSTSKFYILLNQSDSSVVLKGSATTGVTVLTNTVAVIAWNGTDFQVIASTDPTQLVGAFGTINSLSATGITARQAATQDGVRLQGRAGGTSDYEVTITPATLSADRTLTLPDTSTTVVGTDATQTLTNKTVQPRVVAVADSSSITINVDTSDIVTQANTQVAGTLTMNAPTGTPYNGQRITLRIRSTNVQTFSWNAAFAGSTDLPLPTTTSGNTKYDYLGFIYNSTSTTWQFVARTFGF